MVGRCSGLLDWPAGLAYWTGLLDWPNVPRVISAAELSSIGTAVDELGVRVARAADDLIGTRLEDVGVELYEVERALRMARRRLTQAAKSLD